MKIKLVRCFFSKKIYKVFDGLPKEREIRNPLGLQILAKVLKEQGHNCEIIDGELDGLNNRNIALCCIDADIIGITCTTPEFHIACDLANIIKTLNPKCRIILGGPHPTVVPKECMEANSNIDFVVRYEGEETFLELIKNIEKPKQIKGIAYRNGDNIIVNPDRSLLKNLDKYNANWSSINPKKYLYPFPREGLVPTAGIAAMRGCPYHCRYCTRLFGNKVRMRKPQKVYEEMKYIKETFDITHFFFYDECFGLDKKWLLEFLRLIMKLDIKFFCMSRANLIFEPRIREMKKAGLVKMSVGVESGNQQILDNEKKDITLGDCIYAYKILNKYGIETRGSFIFGHPNETHKTARETIEFAKKLKMYRASFNVMTPYPGTDILNDSGLQILNKDYSHYCRWGDCVVRTKELSPEDLKNYQKIALKEFYLQPKVLFYHFKQFLLGERSAYFFRPLKFAIKELFK